MKAKPNGILYETIRKISQ